MGKFSVMRQVIPPAERFWDKVSKRGPDDCWEWTSPRTERGYGKISVGRAGEAVALRAHRLSWEMHNGVIPYGLCVLHKCDNPPCVNPAHLFLGSRADNARDRDAKGRHRSRSVTGEAHPSAKLTAVDVKRIRQLSASGTNKSALSRQFAVSRTTIQQIVQRGIWKRV